MLFSELEGRGVLLNLTTESYLSLAPSWRVLAYYPVRFRDVWVRHRRAVWQIVRRDKAFMADARREARLREYLGWR